MFAIDEQQLERIELVIENKHELPEIALPLSCPNTISGLIKDCYNFKNTQREVPGTLPEDIRVPMDTTTSSPGAKFHDSTPSESKIDDVLYSWELFGGFVSFESGLDDGFEGRLF